MSDTLADAPLSTGSRRPRRRWARGVDRPRYLQPGDVDRVMFMMVALMSEVSALRDRLDTHEALAETGKVATSEEVEAFELTGGRQETREESRQAMLRRVLRAIIHEREAASDDHDEEIPPMNRADALKVAEKAFSEGEAKGVVNMSVVVTDPGGHVRLAMRADGQGNFGVESATAKAVSALGFNRSSLALTPAFSPQATTGIAAATAQGFAPIGGGVVVVDEGGRIIGGAAVSGGPPEVDHAIIVSALEACGFKSLP